MIMKDTVQKILAGDVRTAARLIRNIDDNVPGVRDVLKALYPHTGKAYVVGITGAPGVGKSTLVDQMISHLRRQKKTVGVLAVDPTSPFSGGAILGDRIRMQRHTSDEGVFIRSLATRGQFGGLSVSTGGAINVMDAMGKDYVLVETVGVGQDEVDVVRNAYTTVILLMPGTGDDIQVIKAGILETGDIFVINKADREGVDRTESYLRQLLEMKRKRYGQEGWTPPILRTKAVADKGVDSLLKEIQRHGQHLFGAGQNYIIRKDASRIRNELTEMLKHRILEEVAGRFSETGLFDMAVQDILSGKTDPYTACDALVRPVLDSLEDRLSD